MRASLRGCFDSGDFKGVWLRLLKQKPKVMPKMIFFIIKHNNVVIIFMIAVARSSGYWVLAPGWQFLGEGLARCIHSVSLFMLGLWSLGIWARLILSARRNGDEGKAQHVMKYYGLTRTKVETKRFALFCLPGGWAKQRKTFAPNGF